MKNFFRALLLLLLLLMLPAFLCAETPTQVEAFIGGLTDSSGNPLAGGKIYTYSCGTTSNKTTWQDAAKLSTHVNPVILDGQGKKLVFADGCYKFRIDSSADVTLYTLDGLNFGRDKGADIYGGTSTGSGSAYVVTLSPALLALTNGTRVTFEANHTNTVAATLNVNGVGVRDLNRADDSQMGASEIISGTTYTAVYEASTDAWLLQAPTNYSGSYTPTHTLVTNMAASTAIACNYFRSGNMVTVGCVLNVDPTAAGPTATELGITLPIASDLVGNDLYGTCAAPVSSTEHVAAIVADTSNNRANMQWATGDSANHTMVCVFTYLVH